MGGDDVGVGVVRRVLHGAEVPDLVFLGDDHQAAGVLAGGALDADAARWPAGSPPPRQTVMPRSARYFFT